MKGIPSLLLLLAHGTSAAVTLYNGDQFAGETATVTTADGAAPVYTGLPAYDPLRLETPPPPAEPVTQVEINFPVNPVGAGYQLSKQQKGNFMGFSIEL